MFIRSSSTTRFSSSAMKVRNCSTSSGVPESLRVQTVMNTVDRPGRVSVNGETKPNQRPAKSVLWKYMLVPTMPIR